MSKLREAAEMALEALENLQGLCTDAEDGCLEAITIWTPEVTTALRDALATCKQDLQVEPVACIGTNGELMWLNKPNAVYSKARPLYTHPPQREPLTDEEVIQMALDAGFERNSLSWTFTYGRLDYHLTKFARAIERAHGIGEKV